MTSINVLIVLSASQLIMIIYYGFRVIRFLSRIELQHEMMWTDFQNRTGHLHKRRTDKSPHE